MSQVHHCHIGSFATSGQPPGVPRQSLQSIETGENESFYVEYDTEDAYKMCINLPCATGILAKDIMNNYVQYVSV